MWQNLLLMKSLLIHLNLTWTSTFPIFPILTLGMAISSLKEASKLIIQPYTSAGILTEARPRRLWPEKQNAGSGAVCTWCWGADNLLMTKWYDTSVCLTWCSLIPLRTGLDPRAVMYMESMAGAADIRRRRKVKIMTQCLWCLRLT